MTATFDLRVDSIAAGGDGVGRHEGLVVFVPRTAPGDVARVTARQEGRLMRGRLLELLTPSPDRVEAQCAHYVRDRCGGCQVQHLAYGAQRRAKSIVIADALTRIARRHVQAPDVEASPNEWRYRTKLTLTLRRTGDTWIGGLRRFDAPDEVFDLVDCTITDERVVTYWRSVMVSQRLLPDARELRGALRLVEAGFAFMLEGARTWPACQEFFAETPAMAELWWQPEGQRRRCLASRQAGSHASASFTQVNPAVAAALRDHVVRVAHEHHPSTVVDAYAGTGDTAVRLAEDGARVTAIEIDRDAARVCAARLPTGSRVIAAAVEDALPEAVPADVVILNPPRAGVDARVTQTLRAESHAAGTIIYVSCDAATLARDVKRLEGWHIRSLRAFDMFPQTAHVETVCELVPVA